MPEVGLPPVFHDHVGMCLEERDELLRGGHEFLVHHAAHGLGDHVRDAREHLRERVVQSLEGLRGGQGLDVGQGAAGVVGRGLSEAQELPIRRAAGARRLGGQVLDLQGAALDPLQVAVIRGEARQVLGPAQEAQQHADAIEQEGRIGRMVDRHRHHRAVDAHDAARLHLAGRRTRDEERIERGERLRLHAPEIGGQRGLRGRGPEASHAAERPVAHRVGQVELQLGERPAIELAGDRDAERLIAREARAAGAGIPGTGGEEVLLNERGEARLCVEEFADDRELRRVLVADPRRGECELLDVAHSAVSPRFRVGVLTTPNL